MFIIIFIEKYIYYTNGRTLTRVLPGLLNISQHWQYVKLIMRQSIPTNDKSVAGFEMLNFQA